MLGNNQRHIIWKLDHEGIGLIWFCNGFHQTWILEVLGHNIPTHLSDDEERLHVCGNWRVTPLILYDHLPGYCFSALEQIALMRITLMLLGRIFVTHLFNCCMKWIKSRLIRFDTNLPDCMTHKCLFLMKLHDNHNAKYCRRPTSLWLCQYPLLLYHLLYTLLTCQSTSRWPTLKSDQTRTFRQHFWMFVPNIEI